MKKTRLCAVIWQQCNVLCRAPRLFATSIHLSLSLSGSLCGSHVLYPVYFCLIERRRVPESENKDAKQRQIELLFGVLLVTTAAL